MERLLFKAIEAFWGGRYTHFSEISIHSFAPFICPGCVHARHPEASAHAAHMSTAVSKPKLVVKV